MSSSNFGEYRAQRYYQALKICPEARVSELIPAFLFLSNSKVQRTTVIDFASGSGYLANMLGALFNKVIRVDRSESMLHRSEMLGDPIEADLREAASKLAAANSSQIDAITCLAGLHHIFAVADGKIDLKKSERAQIELLRTCVELLIRNGQLLIIDVCMPDFSAFNNTPIFANRMKNYYLARRKYLASKKFLVEEELLSRLDFVIPDYHLREHVQTTRGLARNQISLADMLEAHWLPSKNIPDKIIPVDYFEEVVDNYSIDRHIACFPDERRMFNTLKRLGLKNVIVTVLPTPWIFKSEVEATWFVRELFGLGESSVPTPDGFAAHQEYDQIKSFITKYLGLYSIGNNTYVNWQLMFAYGEKS